MGLPLVILTSQVCHSFESFTVSLILCIAHVTSKDVTAVTILSKDQTKLFFLLLLNAFANVRICIYMSIYPVHCKEEPSAQS